MSCPQRRDARRLQLRQRPISEAPGHPARHPQCRRRAGLWPGVVDIAAHAVQFFDGIRAVLREPGRSAERRRLEFTLLGNAQLNHEMGRTWTRRFAYQRSLAFHEGFVEPFLAQSVSPPAGAALPPAAVHHGAVCAGVIGVGTNNDYDSSSAYRRPGIRADPLSGGVRQLHLLPIRVSRGSRGGSSVSPLPGPQRRAFRPRTSLPLIRAK